MTRLLLLRGRGGAVTVERGFHGADQVWRDSRVQRKGQLAAFEKACGGEVLAETGFAEAHICVNGYL